jgi:hypothetical protein
MNLAFSAVLLFVLSLPGVIARRVYLSYPFAKKYSISSINDEVAWSLIPALVLQYLMLKIVGWKFSYTVDYQVLGSLIAGGGNGVATEIAFENIRAHFDQIALYNGSLWIVAASVGFLARRFVILSKLDLRWEFLHFSNEWYYFLTGREWGLRLGVDFDIVSIDALVHDGSRTIIYSGAFDSYKLAPEGKLDYVCLQKAQRWMGPKASAPVDIPGKGLVIKYEDTVNLNLSFIKLSPTIAAPASGWVRLGRRIRAILPQSWTGSAAPAKPQSSPSIAPPRLP